jgi:hypothetical protein
MAIYPTSNKNKYRKYYRGGQLPQGSVDSPIVGIGLQYRPTAADIPDLSTLDYLDQNLRAQDARVEAERQKRMFDRKLYRENINKIQGPPGAKGKLQADFDSVLDRYEEKLRDDIDYGLRPEGVVMAKEIEDVFNPQRIERMRANYIDLTTQYDTSLKQGTSNQPHVVSGMASVLDLETGQFKKVHVSQLNGTDARKYKPLTNKEHYEAALNHPEYDISQSELSYAGADIKNTDEILKDWSSRFAGIGYTGTSDGLGFSRKGNDSQIANIKQSIKNGLSQQDRDAMLGLYLSKNNSTYDKKQFDRWINGVIDDIAAGKRIFDEDYKVPTSSGSKGKSSDSSDDELGMPYRIDESSQVTGERDNLLGFSKSYIGVLSSGRSSYNPGEPINVTPTGNVYKLSDDTGYTKEQNQVSPNKKYSGKPVFGMVNYVIMPEFTGEEITIKDGKSPNGSVPKVKESSKYKAGMLVSPDFHGQAVTTGQKKDIAYDSKGKPYEYTYVVIETGGENGEVRALVNNYGRIVTSEKNAEGEFTGTKYISDIDYKESFRYLQGDVVRTKDMSKQAYNSNAITAAGRKAIIDILQSQVQKGRQLAVAIQRNSKDPRTAERAEEYELSRAISIVLNDFINGKTTTPESSGMDKQFIQDVLDKYTSQQGLQKMMDEKYYELIKKNTNRPKGSFTQNTGNIEGM